MNGINGTTFKCSIVGDTKIKVLNRQLMLSIYAISKYHILGKLALQLNQIGLSQLVFMTRGVILGHTFLSISIDSSKWLLIINGLQLIILK